MFKGTEVLLFGGAVLLIGFFALRQNSTSSTAASTLALADQRQQIANASNVAEINAYGNLAKAVSGGIADIFSAYGDSSSD